MLYREKKNLLYEMNKNVSWLTLFSLLKVLNLALYNLCEIINYILEHCNVLDVLKTLLHRCLPTHFTKTCSSACTLPCMLVGPSEVLVHCTDFAHIC